MSYIIDILKSNKRFKYVGIMCIITLFCLVLNITFSAFTSSSNKNVANIKAGNLTYQTLIDGEETYIIEATANNINKKNVILINSNNIDTKYELTYEVCTNINCSSTTSKPENLKVEYSSKTKDNVNGTINKSGTKIIRLVVTNDTETTYYIKLGINAGFSYNALALKNQINSEYSEEDLTILTFIDEVKSDNLPSTKDYDVSIECNNNASGTASWDTDKWLITINNFTKSETVCRANFTTKVLDPNVPDHWYDAGDTTLLYALRNDSSNNIQTPLTTPGHDVSTDSEALLARTTDDYGYSLYFRGNVQNNYVSFAGMCWRIVRVLGNGAIKLTLENNTTTDCTTTTRNAAFADIITLSEGEGDETVIDNATKTVFNNEKKNNAYIGYMYGDPDGKTIASVHANTTDSTILTNLKTWYNNNLSTYSNYLEDVIWCNDKSFNDAEPGKSGIGKNDTDYSALTRLRTSETANPTLICPADNLGGKLSKFTSSDTEYGNGALNGYPIGLLTADEVVFAGSKFGFNVLSSGNLSFLHDYLNSDNIKAKWWTMTPYKSINARMVAVKIDGGLVSEITDEKNGVRPAIALKALTTISGGNGTAASPYIITS